MNPKLLPIGSDEERKLIAVAKILDAVSPNNYDYEVEGTYFDYGQRWMWTTIICHDYIGSRKWQAITPNEWEHIITSETIADLCVIAEHITKGEHWLDK